MIADGIQFDRYEIWWDTFNSFYLSSKINDFYRETKQAPNLLGHPVASFSVAWGILDVVSNREAFIPIKSCHYKTMTEE